MYLKEKIKLTGNDVKLKISLSSNNNLNGLQQSINDFIEEETGLSINPVTDGETFRYQNNLSNKGFQFNFYNGSTYSDSLINAGFTASEILSSSQAYKGSFYIMQVFDSIDSENQTLLHTGFLNGSNFVNATSSYIIFSTDEFANLYLEENYVDSISASTFLVYAKFFFFNAKLGKLQPFFNQFNEFLTTEGKLYQTIEVTKATRKYSFVNPSTIISKELVNSDYSTKVNNTLDSFSNEKPTYPIGTKFTVDGTYETEL